MGAGLVACSTVTPTAVSPTPHTTLNPTATATALRVLPPTATNPPPTPTLVPDTPAPTPTPDLRWAVTAIPIEPPVYEPWAGSELTPTPLAFVTPVPKPGVTLVFSPDRQFFLECSSIETRLYRSVDLTLLAQAPINLLTEYGCSPSVTWSPDATRVALQVAQDLYLWSTTGAPSQHVPLNSEYYLLAWAPRAERLLVLEEVVTAGQYCWAPLVVAVAGELQRWPDICFSGDPLPNGVNWLNENIVEVQMGGSLCCVVFHYLDADTGQQFPTWTHGYDASQFATFSPDRRWRVADTTQRVWQGEPYASPDYFAHVYSVLDFHTGQSYTLLRSVEQYVQWVGWATDSRTFYFVVRPASATVISDPAWPYGLYALDPATGAVTLLFEQAMFATLSPDARTAWVVYPAKRQNDTLGLDAGIFDLASKTFAGRYPVLDQVVYLNSRGGTLVPHAWSSDSHWLVWGDAQGNLLLQSATGEVLPLASKLPGRAWPDQVTYTWSPDNQRLLVQYAEYAWLVAVPAR